MTDTCGVCHRPLLDPESRAAGIGPVCAEKFHPPRGRRTAGPDQLTFEEHHMDDTDPASTTYHPLRFATPRLLRFARLIDTERQAQLAKFGDQHHPDGSSTSTNVSLCTKLAEAMRTVNASPAELSWTTIMLEEAYEVGAETDPAKIRAELIQLAAVCAAWIADIDSRPRACAHCGQPITGEGITWTGPMPAPGEDEYLVPRYHLSLDYPDCRRASGTDPAES
ncbi:DUF6011 domain-containing protein [Streptomyces sp. OR43]|uniref:DUF6011 domain-containing protein n=1 Tax=Streptomyces sp. or43 TaxID=2478957 RepID=UPI0011CDB2BA|nr:DUF6011 domain-containing protein [Streptomyces sp. or43]TXS36944.1 hypothetical protein EAO72_26530 [Streptomyces sp. or43]